MDFGFTDEQEEFRQEIADFCKAEMQDGIVSPSSSPSFIQKVAQKGWLGLAIPEEYGGLGKDAIYRVIFNEEMAYNRAPMSLNLWGRSYNLFGRICLRYGSEEQKKRWLPRLARGEAFGQCYTEPEAGTDMTSIQTRAVRQGDYYIVSGQKMFITTAHILKHTLMMARTDPDAPAERGLSMFVMDNTSPGLSHTPLMGMRGYRTNQLFLDNVMVPVENLIGEENRGYEYFLWDKPFYLHKEQGAEIGALRQSFEELVRYSKDTRRNGRLLCENQMVRQRLAEMATNIRAMRFLSYRMAWMESRGLDITDIASKARVFIVEGWLKFNSTALQLLGLGGLVERGSNHAALGGAMAWHYQYEAIQYFTRGSPSYTKSVIATHELGMPES
jgi:alkylation response protein AidB-like acyl-CoA dehydrogenase